MSGNKQSYECSKCKNNYSTAYSMYRHMRKVHNCDIHRCVTLYCPIENCNQSYDRYNALDTHLTHVHYADIRKETFNFSDLTDFEAWLRDITQSSKTKYIKRSCNNSYRYYRCHRSGLPKTSTDKINSMKSSVKIGRHCPSRIIAKITDRSVQVEFVPTHIGHECEIAKIPLSQKKRLDIACRLQTSSTTNSVAASVAALALPNETQQQQQLTNSNQHQQHTQHLDTSHLVSQQASQQQTGTSSAPTNQQNNQQATTSAIQIQNDNSLMVTLAPMKVTTTQDQQLGHTMQQQPTHILQQTQIAQQQQLTTNQANNSSGLMTLTSPNRSELTSRFEQLMSAIRSDKHVSIVKAQLEFCLSLVQPD